MDLTSPSHNFASSCSKKIAKTGMHDWIPHTITSYLVCPTSPVESSFLDNSIEMFSQSVMRPYLSCEYISTTDSEVELFCNDY